MARRIPLSKVPAADAPAEPLRQAAPTRKGDNTTPQARPDNRDNTTPGDRHSNPGAAEGKAADRSPGRKEQMAANTTPGSTSGSKAVCVFQTRQMPVRLRDRMKALGTMLRMSQQEIVFKCLEVGMPWLAEDAGLDWAEVERLLEQWQGQRR